MKCRSCGAEIVWMKTEAGRNMPLNPDPVRDGNIALMRNQAGRIIAVYVKKGDPMPEEAYKSHFATCPNAKSHRQKQNGDGVGEGGAPVKVVTTVGELRVALSGLDDALPVLLVCEDDYYTGQLGAIGILPSKRVVGVGQVVALALHLDDLTWLRAVAS